MINITSRTKSMPKRSQKTPSRTAAVRAPQTGRRKRASATRLGKTYEAGRQTRGTIVRAAAAVLIQDGHARFSVQRVAAKAGIAPGNLNYYFPTKASLLETLITYTLAQYRDRVRAAARQMNPQAKDSLGEVLLWLMEDARSEGTTRLFRELWAIALHDPQIAKAMDSFYTRSANAYLQRAGDKSAMSTEGELEAIIYLMLVISEGVSVIFGTRPTAGHLFSRVREAAHGAIMHLLAKSASRGSTGKAD